MNKLNLQVVSASKLPKRNTTGTFTYIVKGSKKDLAEFARIQGDALVVDEKTGEYKWFTGEWFPYATIVLKEGWEDMEEGNPWEIDLFGVEPRAMQMAMQAKSFLDDIEGRVSRPSSSSVNDDDEDDDDDEPELEAPAPAPKSKRATTSKLARGKK